MLLCTGLLVAALPSPGKADEWNKKTDVTFNGPVEIPGIVLPAGKYVFKLADSQSDRNIVQIFNADETHLYATILAVPDYRLQPTGKTVVNFEERAAGAPEAVQAWFYPGDNYGNEFVYPKVKATQLAQVNNKPVPSMPQEMAKNITTPAKTMKEPQVMAMKKTPLKAVKPTGEQVEIAEVIMPAPAAQKPARRLPATASELPLLTLIGLLALGVAAGLRAVSKRVA
jgi:hypothetical protein